MELDRLARVSQLPIGDAQITEGMALRFSVFCGASDGELGLKQTDALARVETKVDDIGCSVHHRDEENGGAHFDLARFCPHCLLCYPIISSPSLGAAEEKFKCLFNMRAFAVKKFQATMQVLIALLVKCVSFIYHIAIMLRMAKLGLSEERQIGR